MKAPEKLKAWRTWAGRGGKSVSQREAAERCGMSQSAWAGFESGRQEPSVEYIDAFDKLTRGSPHHVSFPDWASDARARKRARAA